MTEYPDLKSVWTVSPTMELAKESLLQANAVGIRVEAGEVLAGLDSAMNRHLLVPLLPGEAVPDAQDGAAVRLTRVKFQSRSYLSALCTVRRLDSVFTQFARELLEVLNESTSPAKDVTRTFRQWKALFAAASGPGLGISEQIGLLAELQLLEQLIKMGSTELTHWRGPEGSEHDFRSGNMAIEVKATLARDGRRTSISSIHQLEAPDGGTGRLALAYNRFEHNPSGDSLPLAVERILDLGIDATVLERKLHRVGYFDSHHDVYVDSCFATKEQKFYDVNQKHFPRITASSFIGGSLPPGVEALSYIVDLTNEPPVAMDSIEVHDLLEGFITNDS